MDGREADLMEEDAPLKKKSRFKRNSVRIRLVDNTWQTIAQRNWVLTARVHRNLINVLHQRFAVHLQPDQEIGLYAIMKGEHIPEDCILIEDDEDVTTLAQDSIIIVKPK